MLEDQFSHEYTVLAAGAVMEREQIRVGKLTFAVLQSPFSLFSIDIPGSLNVLCFLPSA